MAARDLTKAEIPAAQEVLCEDSTAFLAAVLEFVRVGMGLDAETRLAELLGNRAVDRLRRNRLIRALDLEINPAGASIRGRARRIDKALATAATVPPGADVAGDRGRELAREILAASGGQPPKVQMLRLIVLGSDSDLPGGG